MKTENCCVGVKTFLIFQLRVAAADDDDDAIVVVYCCIISIVR